MFQEVGFAREVAHQTTGFADQQRTRCHVPDGQTGLKEAIGKTCSYIGQIQRGRAGAAHASGALHDFAQHQHVLLEVVATAEGEAGGDQAVTQLSALGDADAALVQIGTTALGRSEQVVAAGVIDHGVLDLALVGQSDAHAVHGKAVDEVGGAVQRVDDPDMVGVLGAVLAARFFGQDGMLGVGVEQRFDDDALGGLVYLGHKVVHLLLRNAHRFHIQGGTVDEGASGAGSLDGHVKHGVQGVRHKL